MAGGSFETRQSFDADTFAARYGGATVLRLKSGARLYSQGEPADSVYYVQRGRIQITVVSTQGKEGILGILESDAVCGEGCLLGNRLRVATATCIADSTVARLERANVLRAIRTDPSISEFFLLFALTNVVRLRENLISQLFDSSEQRLARTLLALANQSRDAGSKNVIRNIDQEALAHMIGTTRSRVNFFMNKFRKLGYIDYEGGVIFVHDSLSNAALRDDVSHGPGGEVAVAC